MYASSVVSYLVLGRPAFFIIETVAPTPHALPTTHHSPVIPTPPLPDPPLSIPTHPQTCLHIAAGRGHLPLVQHYLTHGADKNGADGLGRTPLHTATESGHEAVVQYLLRQGADRHKADHVGLTPMQSPCKPAVAVHLQQRGGSGRVLGRWMVALCALVGILGGGYWLWGNYPTCLAYAHEQGWVMGKGAVKPPVPLPPKKKWPF